MKRTITIFAAFFIFYTAYSQEEVIEYDTKSGQNIEHIIPIDRQYILPEFEQCSLLDKNGQKFSGIVNIHLPSNTLRMIDPDGDTLEVSNADDIRTIISRDHKILHIDRKFIIPIAEHKGITLSVLPSIIIEFFDKMEHDYIVDIANVRNDAVSWNTGSIKMIIVPDVLSDKVTMRCTYKSEYVLTSGDKVYPCRLSSFYKVFPKKKNLIRTYAHDNYIYFHIRESVLNLFNFCIQDT